MGEAAAKPGSRARWLRVSGATLLAALLVHGAVWWWTVRRIEAGLPGFAAQARSVGWEISGGTPSWAGWPLAATVRVPDVVATRKLGAATLRVGFERLDVALSPADRSALHVIASGEHRVELGDGAPVRLRAQTATLRVMLDEAGPLKLVIRGLDATGQRNEGITVSALDATIDETAVGAALAATARGVQARPSFTAPFDTGGDIDLRLLVAPPFPPAADPAASAALWQRAGGSVSLPEISIKWGPLMGSGHAAGGLDGDLQPAGLGEVAATGLVELLDAASRAGLLPPSAAQAIRAVLGILAMAAHGAPLRLPVGLANGTIEVAQFPLARIPRLDWGAR